MTTATNVDAIAVNTVAWLSAAETTIVVPVYQRQYRWDIGGCEQLLADIRAVADSDDRHTHFIGSILSTHSTEGAPGELVLIDGQQRITTLMLLVAALHDTMLANNPALAAQLKRVIVSAADPGATKLRPHRAWALVFESVVLGTRDDDSQRDSRFDDNYAFFRSQVAPDEVERIWRGLQRLEHVSITLKADANAQQIFESLNSTGEPLRDHELIHNYVLMGLSHSEQSEIEDEFWLPIEQNTGDSIAGFWRHYLVMLTGREVDLTGGRGVYDAFRREFPRLDVDTLRTHATDWREFSALYGTLIDPTTEPDADVARQLGYINAFGRATYPLVMLDYRDYSRDAARKDDLIMGLERIQSLLLRRTVVGVSNDRLVARLCRARANGAESLLAAIARVTPSNDRVRVALKFGALPHAAYVLGRLSSVDSLVGVHLDHIFPVAPADTWSGDGVRQWSEYSDDEQNSHRALAETLGNLALLEEALAERGLDLPFLAKSAGIYASSAIAGTRALVEDASWGTAAIAGRTARLTTKFLELWARPATVDIDDDGLTPALDAKSRRGWPRGWQREFEYVEYRGEHWDVFDIKYLFNRVFKRLWADSRDSVVSFSAHRGGPIFEAQAWNGQWDELDETHFIYMGWDSKYMLSAVQGVLEEAGIAAEVFVKYSYIGDAM